MKNKQILILILILLLIALTCIAWLSSFTRLYADDYCIGADAQHVNPFSFFQKWYSSWTGRFSYIVLAGIFSLGGAGLAAVLPTFSMAVWLLGLTWALFPLMKRFWREKTYLPSFALGALILLILFKSTPNLFQSFFWRDGLINYTFPLIGLTICAGFLIRTWLENNITTGSLIVIGMVSFISGGFSEVASVMQVANYALWVLIMAFMQKTTHKKSNLKALFAAMIGAVLALLVVLLSPGNAVRQSLLAAHPGILRLITFSIRNAIFIAAKFFIQTPGWAFLTLFVSLWAGLNIAKANGDNPSLGQAEPVFSHRPPGLVRLLLVPLTTFLVMVAACAPVVYTLNAYPDDRTILLPEFILIVGVFISGMSFSIFAYQKGFLKSILNKRSTNRWLTVAVVACVLIATLSVVRGTIQDLIDYQGYTAAWESRDKDLHSQAAQNAQQVIAPGLESRFGLSDLQVEDDFWVNRCMADYYGISSIIGK